MSQSQYESNVVAAKAHIAAGDIFQVVLSQRFSRQTHAHPLAIYRALRMLNPSPYMFYLDFGEMDLQVVGASPEMHVRLEDGIARGWSMFRRAPASWLTVTQPGSIWNA